MKELNVMQMEEINGGATWQCWFGTIGSGVLGALAGAALGPAGAIAGGLAGDAVGAATFC